MTSEEPIAQATLRFEDDVAWITFSNPGKRNSFTWGMYEQLSRYAAELPPETKAVVFRGSPEDGFAAGTDIRQFVGFSGQDGLEYERTIGKVLEAVLAIPVPVISLVEGAAVGAGLAVAACSDIVIAERGAVFGAPIGRSLGNCIPPTVLSRLRTRMGESNTMGMMLTATLLSAEHLAASGFVFRLTEPGGLVEAAGELLKRIRTSAPLTLRSLKEMNRRITAEQPLPDCDDLLLTCYGSEDFAEGVEAFLAGRHPVWKGR